MYLLPIRLRRDQTRAVDVDLGMGGARAGGDRCLGDVC